MLLSPAELYDRLDEPGLVAVDSRAETEFALGHLPGAVNLPANLLQDPESLRKALLPPDAGTAERRLQRLAQRRIPDRGRSTSDGFLSHFAGMSADDPIEVGHDIDSISGASVSVTGVTRAVRSAIDILAQPEARSAGDARFDDSGRTAADQPLHSLQHLREALSGGVVPE